MNDFDHIERNQVAIMRALAALVDDLILEQDGLADSLRREADATQAFLEFKLKPVPTGGDLSLVIDP